MWYLMLRASYPSSSYHPGHCRHRLTLVPPRSHLPPYKSSVRPLCAVAPPRALAVSMAGGGLVEPSRHGPWRGYRVPRRLPGRRYPLDRHSPASESPEERGAGGQTNRREGENFAPIALSPETFPCVMSRSEVEELFPHEAVVPPCACVAMAPKGRHAAQSPRTPTKFKIRCEPLTSPTAFS